MTNNFENLLTKSAKEELDKYLLEEKDRILSDAYTKASALSSDVQEISLRDILEAKDLNNLQGEQLKYVDLKRKRMTTVLAMSGVLYTIIGFLIYLYQSSKLDIMNNLGLMIAVIGILVTFMSFFMYQMRFIKIKSLATNNNVKTHSFDSDFTVVERWSIIENLARKLIEKENNESPRSFNQILSFLKASNTLTKEEQIKLRDLLVTRNEILHNSIKLHPSRRKEILDLADELINKIEKEI